MDIIEVFVFVIYIFIVMDVNGCIVIEEENLVEVQVLEWIDEVYLFFNFVDSYIELEGRLKVFGLLMLVIVDVMGKICYE